jgi:hypothetical protein
MDKPNDSYTPQDPVTADELSRKRAHQVPTEGRIKLGLGNEDLLALRNKTPAEISQHLDLTVDQAAGLLKRVQNAIERNADEPRPGMLNLPYFMVVAKDEDLQPRINEILGERVYQMNVKFMHAFDVTASISYRWYGQSGLHCYSTGTVGTAMRWDDKGNRVPHECKRLECPEFIEGKCRRRGRLFLRIDDLQELNLYNPFMLTLHSSNVTDRLIGQVEMYAKLIEKLGKSVGTELPLSAPLFELRKTDEDRQFPVPQKDGTTRMAKRKQHVPDLLLRGSGLEKLGPAALEQGTQAIAALTEGGEPVEEMDVIDLGVDDIVNVDDALGPAVDMEGEELNLTQQPNVPEKAQVETPRETKARRDGQTTVNDAPTPPLEDKFNKTRPKCAVCGVFLDDAVVKWCQDFAGHYDGKLLCREHQKPYGSVPRGGD